MLKFILCSLLIIGCVLPSQVAAQSEPSITDGLVLSDQPPTSSAEALLKLPTVYALPGSHWYWLKRTWEQIQLWLTLDDQKRAELLLTFSQQRLEEGYQAMKDGNFEAAATSLENYQQQQLDLAGNLDQMRDNPSVLQSLLDRLKIQLYLQQVLHLWSNDIDSPDSISHLLEVRPVQTLALNVQEQQWLLGAMDVRPTPESSISAESTQSARQSSSEAAMQEIK